MFNSTYLEQCLDKLYYLVSKRYSTLVMHFQCLHSHNFLPLYQSNKHRKVTKFTISTKLFKKLGNTIFSICDSHLITSDHQILIGCNTFLWVTRASSRGVTTIKKVIKIFLLMFKWSIQ